MTTLWILWIVMFALLEGYALVKHVKGGTLSAHLRKWFSLEHHGKIYWVRRAAWGLVLLWFVFHFFFES